MEIKTNRLTLREFSEHDFDKFYSIFTDERIMRYAWRDAFSSEQEAMTVFERIILRNLMVVDSRDVYEFAIHRTEDNTFIGYGNIEVYSRNSYGGVGEIGYFLLPDFWGKGFATEIAKALIGYGFEQIKLHKMTARCNANNLNSEHIMQKIGMTKEGHLRKVRLKKGQWDDEKHYGILKEEWAT